MVTTETPRPRTITRHVHAWDAAVCALALAVVEPVTAHALDIARHLPPAGATYVAEEVRIRCDDGNSLGGTLTLPTRGVLTGGRRLRYAAVVLIGDAGGGDRDGVPAADSSGGTTARPLYDLADALTRRGIAVLRFDDRGDGASTGAAGVTPYDRASEARAALELLRHRPEINSARIGAVSLGDGSTSALLLGAMEPALLGLVMLSPRASSASAALPADTSDSRGTFWGAFDPIATARAVSLPALLVYGEADPARTHGEAEGLAAALRAGSSDVTLRLLPGLARDLMPAAGGDSATGAPPRLGEAVLDPVGGWLSLRLGPPSTYRAPVATHAPRVAKRARR